MGYVQQTPIMVAGSVQDNLLYPFGLTAQSGQQDNLLYPFGSVQ